MTRKDYKAVAKLIVKFRQRMRRTQLGQTDECVVHDLIVPLAHLLERDNPEFDYDGFLAACNAAEVS